MIKPNPKLFLGCPAELRRYIADLEQQVKTADERTVAAIQHQQALHQQLKQSSLDPHCACASPTMCGNALTPQQNGGFPTEHCSYVKHQSNQPDLYHMFIEQNLERRTEQRKPTTSFDWELQQALIHLQNAISVTDSHRAHLLQAAAQITKGVRESE